MVAPRYIYPSTVKHIAEQLPNGAIPRVVVCDPLKQTPVVSVTALTSLPTVPTNAGSRISSTLFSPAVLQRVRDIYRLEEDPEERVLIPNKEMEAPVAAVLPATKAAAMSVAQPEVASSAAKYRLLI